MLFLRPNRHFKLQTKFLKYFLERGREREREKERDSQTERKRERERNLILSY